MSTKSSRVQRLGWAAVIVLLALVVGGIAAAQDEDSPQKVTISGFLEGIEEDDGGNPQRVYIQDDNLGPILVVDDEKGDELLELVGSQVEVSGLLEHTDEATVEGYDYQIRVWSYEVLD